MFHGVKKFVGVHKASNACVDSEYDDLRKELPNLQKNCRNMSTAFESSQKVWESLNKNGQMAVDAVGVSGDDDIARLAESVTEGSSWHTEVTSESKDAALEFLADFTKFLKQLDADCKARDILAKDVDYYRGKTEDLQKSNKPKDLEKLPKAEDELASKESEYESANAIAKEKLQYMLELKSTFAKVFVTYFEVQASLMSSCPYFNYIEDYSSYLGGEWPNVNGFEPSYQPSSPPPASSRASTGGRPNPRPAPRPPARGARPQYVTAIYDFQGERSDELTFYAGDKIQLVKEIDADWYEGTFNGKTGMFPSNFVEK